MKQRLDLGLVSRGIVSTRSQAESFIRLGRVTVNGRVVTKPGTFVDDSKVLQLVSEQYVSRAGLKLAGAVKAFKLDFSDKVVLDVGSSTGGFTDYALQHGAHKVVAVDVGTKQLHPSLRGRPEVELHEQTDIRSFIAKDLFDVILVDVSFISLRHILPYIATIATPDTLIMAMVKPQFEADASGHKHHGVIKNDRMRRDILQAFEIWARKQYIILHKADSSVAGSKGNVERFYLLSVMRRI